LLGPLSCSICPIKASKFIPCTHPRSEQFVCNRMRFTWFLSKLVFNWLHVNWDEKMICFFFNSSLCNHQKCNIRHLSLLCNCTNPRNWILWLTWKDDRLGFRDSSNNHRRGWPEPDLILTNVATKTRQDMTTRARVLSYAWPVHFRSAIKPSLFHTDPWLSSPITCLSTPFFNFDSHLCNPTFPWIRKTE